MHTAGATPPPPASAQGHLSCHDETTLLRLSCACQRALLYAKNESTLLHHLCALAVDLGGWDLAWVEMLQGQQVERVACCGVMPPSWPAPQTLAPWQQPTPIAAPATHPDYAHCSQALQSRGLRSALALPLREGERTLGFLHCASQQTLDTELPPAVQALWHTLCTDIAQGLALLRARLAREHMQTIVLKGAAAVSASTGQAFFEQLVHHMAEGLGAQVAAIARLLPTPSGTGARVQTLALSVHATMQAHATYTLEHTPSERLLTQRQYIITHDALQRYPQAPVLRKIQAQAYVGQQLATPDGDPLGIIFVLFTEPLLRPDFVSSTLQIFAARAATEIQRQQAEERIRQQASLLDKARDAIIVRDLTHRVLYWNQGAERMYGWSTLQVLGQRIDTLLYAHPQDFYRASQHTVTQGQWLGEITQRHRNGNPLEVEAHWTLITDENGQAQSILAINTDITARKASERQVQHLAYFDPLTDLPNRLLLMERTTQALAQARKGPQHGALLFIDLDHFKTLNDTLGHDVGDLLLQQVGQRLTHCVHAPDTVARLGGDEFIVLCPQLGTTMASCLHTAQELGEQILQKLSAIYQLGAYQYRSTPSIGIAPFDAHTASAVDLLKQADLAMYQAKKKGRSALCFFEPALEKAVRDRATLEADLRSALAHEAFTLCYQPQNHISGRPVGVEALLRWVHPERGPIAPAQFITLAEETGLILPLGRWVLRQACTVLAQWAQEPLLAHLTMAVNVSAVQFSQADFVPEVLHILATTGAPAKRLKLELTESLWVDNMEKITSTMQALCVYGVQFSLDDFGTGYSSLIYLKRMPLSQLKIDQNFVRDVLTDANDAAIIQTIIDLSRSLGLQVIAEGVETVQQRDVLLQAGCHFYQGFLFSKPLPEAQVRGYLQQCKLQWPAL